MSKAQDTGEPASLHLLHSLHSLRANGAQCFDPVRFAYLEALSCRLPSAAGELRHILEARLACALADYVRRHTDAQQLADDNTGQLPAAQQGKAVAMRRNLQVGDLAGLRRLDLQTATSHQTQPLAELNRYIRSLNPEAGSEARVELKSVRRFRQAWSRIAAADQIDQALSRQPDNAGPLNSHMLVLRSLALMRKLSPDYAQRFLSHVDSLLWLDAQTRQSAPPKRKPPRRSRQAV
jgi:hypothetical protein